ncbi:hypothetical protein FRACYDRAFT_236214 [Fragilariopsis cylindrus CCMP1102]|uniref:Ubiquitin-like domain-containing protein n=1 Tax=Fragilariopsis cylindrus CCMP1102 TaxID=635003 RepID=A0A1E7FPV2_9STRA|nr:hypothetical protein FRACYDRAFT_236214 [Fragilariopsis cylindrus CCMP1102]|eukprot:OEU20144.1 hypothetical protein FRACYDRAFT_236214 [Fragilariopsis cylindrus CCMP1102]
MFGRRGGSDDTVDANSDGEEIRAVQVDDRMIDDDNDDGEDDLKPLLVDDTANNSNNNTTGINNTLSTIGTILSSTNKINSIAAAAANNNKDNSGMRLRIKSSFADIEIEIPNGGCPLTTTVAQLKELVRTVLLEKERTNGNGNGNRHHNNEDRYLRIICKGRLLSPDESFLSEFKVCDEDVIHAVLAAAVVTTSSSTRRQKQQRQTTNSGTSTSTTPHHQQQQRRRHNTNTRQRQHRGLGTVVGPGGRVTRVRTSNNSNGNNDDDSNSDDEHDDIEQGGGGGGEGNSSRRRRRRERRGFDQLRSGGLSRQEITAIRIYFNRQVDRFIIEQQEQQQQQQQPNTGGGSGDGDGDGEDVITAATATTTSNRFLHLDEPDLSRRRLLIEESWMTTQGPASEFRLNLNRNTLLRVAALSGEGGGGGLLRNITTTTGSNSGRQQGNMGNDRDFIWGFCLGFFVGIIGLVWVWVPTVPHKQKIGILTGISFQFFLNKDNMDAESEYTNINGGGVFENTYNDGD